MSLGLLLRHLFLLFLDPSLQESFAHLHAQYDLLQLRLEDVQDNFRKHKSRTRNIRRALGGKEPTIYAIMPTHTRLTQKADLIRLSQTFMHIANFHWIVVEDSNNTTKLVKNVLDNSGLNYTHLNVRTEANMIRSSSDPRWKKHRGVDQRNLGLQWIRTNVSPFQNGVVYFADDDNTYSLELFEEVMIPIIF